VVVGLGEMGSIDADGVTQAVRAGVLRYLLHASDRYGEEQAGSPPTAPTADTAAPQARQPADRHQLGPAARRGRRRAGGHPGRAAGQPGFRPGRREPNARRAIVAELEFVEVYHDTAISAAHAVLASWARPSSELG
jgi:hypothetical protein